MPLFPSQTMDGQSLSLFRFLDDFHRRGASHQITPRFDVCEFQDAYEIHGELPGMEKKDLRLEFADAQTLLVHGVFRRSDTFGTTPKEPKASGSPPPKQEITVSSSGEAKNGPSTTQGDDSLAKTGKSNEPKFWVSERVFGEFSRPFTFINKIYQNGVTAELKDGLLIVRVPKTGESTPHKIEIK